MSKETLRQELTDWVAAYKDAAERNALAEDPDESAEYLISLFEEELEGLTVREPKDSDRPMIQSGMYHWNTISWTIARVQLSHTIKELRERLGVYFEG